MMISDVAFVFLEDARDRAVLRLSRLFRRRHQAAGYQYAAPRASDVISQPAGEDAEVVASDESARSDRLPVPLVTPELHDAGAREIVLSADERRARAIALRGLSQCRGGRFDAARASFVEAAEMDAAIDFAKLPEFWRLPLDAHQAAIEAYEVVGRRRDAAALTAAVRSMFRPKPLRPRPVAKAVMPES